MAPIPIRSRLCHAARERAIVGHLHLELSSEEGLVTIPDWFEAKDSGLLNAPPLP